MQCSAVQCSAVQCSAVQCSAVQCSAVRRDATRRDATGRDGTLRIASHRIATQRNATQRNATQRNATQRNATQRNAISIRYNGLQGFTGYEQLRVSCSRVSASCHVFDAYDDSTRKKPIYGHVTFLHSNTTVICQCSTAFCESYIQYTHNCESRY